MMDDYDLTDADQNKVYTSRMDALEDNSVKVTPGLFMI
jgi:hypothetical protein